MVTVRDGGTAACAAVRRVGGERILRHVRENREPFLENCDGLCLRRHVEVSRKEHRLVAVGEVQPNDLGGNLAE